jgi:hypothetical protein
VYLSRLFPFLLVDHFVKVGRRQFDVEMLILAGAAFGGNNSATVSVLEIAVRKLVSPLGVLTLLAVYPRMPFCERGKTVLTNEFVFFFGGRLMFAPSVSFVPGKVALATKARRPSRRQTRNSVPRIAFFVDRRFNTAGRSGFRCAFEFGDV